MSLQGAHETFYHYSPSEQRGADAYKQIRTQVNNIRALGIEPKCVWVGQSTANDMKSLWKRACGDSWDEVLPKRIAGVEVKAGSTGGRDFLVEYFDSNRLAEAIRRASKWRAVDNPLQGTH